MGNFEKNIVWQEHSVNSEYRATQKMQIPQCIWLTGLSGSGKTSIANVLDLLLSQGGNHVYILDGDNIRHGLSSDLGFSDKDRTENIRRVSEVAKLMVDAGLIVIVSFISPFISERERARGLFEKGKFVEIFIDTSLEECELRDVKGLYAKARKGEIVNFTGIDSPYQPPLHPELRVNTIGKTSYDCATEILKFLVV